MCHCVNDTKKKKLFQICPVTFSSHNSKIIFKFNSTSSSFEIYIKISAQYAVHIQMEKIWKHASIYINIKYLHNHATQITNLLMHGKVFSTLKLYLQ